MNEKTLLAAVEDSLELKKSFFERNAHRILEAGSILAKALRDGHKILAFGNGGSAADAQHFTAELVNHYRYDRPALPAIALTTDTSILTSVANDSAFGEVFRRQVEALGMRGDVVIAISTSGNSPNVLRAVEACTQRGIKVIGLAGREGGELASMADICLVVPHLETSRIQEVHAMLVHFFCQTIEEELFPPTVGH